MKGSQTTARVVSPRGRSSKKALAYFLVLNKIALISSLKSATKTEANATNKLRMSIVDSLQVGIRPQTQLNSQKKSLASLRKPSLIQPTRLFKPFLSSTYQMDKLIITQKGLK
ncbi:hypothetical protein [Campylobacter helveticus]|uniref:hypothetical protein n=1 Tax=Campylobacter helveticus TaxID=28898 RepID=UPI002096015B|nr:hypothetical protein [Campylobacter helveticus]